jgi:hypothetical protein
MVVVIASVFVARQPFTGPRGGERSHVVPTMPAPQVAQVVAPAAPVSRRRPVRKRHPSKPVAQLAAVRMDIQTSDPNVRIIWFAR